MKPNKSFQTLIKKREPVCPITLLTCRLEKQLSTSVNTNYDAVRSGFIGRRSEVLVWLGNRKNVREYLY
jgi:hypothetical protein